MGQENEEECGCGREVGCSQYDEKKERGNKGSG